MEILGAYRVMPVGEQLAQHGVTGLSIATACLNTMIMPILFREVWEIGPRLYSENFYQKSKVLDYLWQGIFDFIKRYPDYNTCWVC